MIITPLWLCPWKASRTLYAHIRMYSPRHAPAFSHLCLLRPYVKEFCGLSTGAPSCTPGALHAAQRLCRRTPGSSVIQRQHLFTVYVHPPPAFGSAQTMLTNVVESWY